MKPNSPGHRPDSNLRCHAYEPQFSYLQVAGGITHLTEHTEGEQSSGHKSKPVRGIVFFYITLHFGLFVFIVGGVHILF